MNVREDLKAYLDGELSPSRMDEVRQAIEADPELADEIAVMRSIGEEIRNLSDDPQIVGMERVLSAVRKRSSSRLILGMRPVFLTGLACACVGLAAYIGFPVFAQTKSSSRGMVASKPAAEDAVTEAAAPDPRASTNSAMPEVGAMPDNGLRLSKGKAAESPGADVSIDGRAERAKAYTSSPTTGDSTKFLAGGESPAAVPPAGEKTARVTQPGKSAASKDSGERDRIAKKDWYAFRVPDRTAPRTINEADVVIQVQDVDAAVQHAQRVANLQGGFMQWADSPRQDAERKRVVLYVPGANFDSALNELVAAGKLVTQGLRRSNSKVEHWNLTQQLDGLKRQLGVWQDRLTRKPNDNPAAVKRQVISLNTQIADLQVRQGRLSRDPTLSNIVATVERKPASRHVFSREPAKDADPQAGAVGVDGRLFRMSVVALVFLVGFLIWRMLKRA